MSLTSMLKGKTEKDMQFQNILKNIIYPTPSFSTLSGKKAFSMEYEDLVPYSLSKTHYASVVGICFDYLARFIIANNIKNAKTKKRAYENLVAEQGLEMFRYYLKGTSICKAVEENYKEGLSLCARFINNKRSDFDKIINFSGHLASLESIARTGKPPADLRESLLGDTNIEITEDLKKLCNVFEDRFINSGLLKEKSEVMFNPNFGMASIPCGGADADIFIDGTLYDFKCTKNRNYNWIQCAQLIGYYMLNVIDTRCGGKGMGKDNYRKQYEIDRVSFYRSRYGEIETLDINMLDKNKLEDGIEKLRKILGLEFI